MRNFLFLISLGTLLLITSVKDTRPGVDDFLLDPSRHYVYLKFDHVGKRDPLLPTENNKGLWLRLVNNCRVPISVAIFNTENADQSVGVYDELVPSIIKAPMPILHFPSAPRRPIPSVQTPAEEMPQGYSPADTFSTTIISPGDNLLLNLPLNHVGPSWGLQIRFYFELPGEGYGTGPYSVVSFDRQDIPEKFREPLGRPTTH